MSRLQVVYADTAITDLWNLTEHIALSAGSYRVAVKYTERLQARIDRVGDAPRGGHNRSDLRAGLRTISFERRILIAYLVQADHVLITNIFYGGRDFEALLRSNETS